MTGEDRPAGLPPLASLARRRLVVAEDYLAGHGVRLDKARRGNLALALADLAPEDPAARTMMPQEMIRNIEMHAREGEEYRILHGLGGQSGSLAMGISFHGLGAFNAAFGHEIADLGLVHMGHGIIEEALHDAGVTSPDNYDIAHHGGGNFTVLVKPSATAPDEVQEKFSSAVASRVAEMNGRKIGDFLHEKDASIDPDAFAAESFATLRDKKRRTVRVDGQDFESRVDGIHAVVVGDVVPDRERLDGGAFISELRDRADAALDAYRAAHLERHLPVRPSRPPSSYPPRPLTLDEAREARIAEIRGGGDRVSLISDLVGRLSSPPPPPDSDPHNDGGGGGQMPNLRAPKMPTI